MTRRSGRVRPREASNAGALLRTVLALAGVILACEGVAAQERDTTIVVGAHYQAGGLHRWLFGGEYRRLWTTPIRAPLLDLSAFGGGLTPTTAGGGLQTLSLRFDGADGRKYGFRSIDKDPDVLDEQLEGTFIEDVVRDQISSAHPAGPAVAAVLMEAAVGPLATIEGTSTSNRGGMSRMRGTISSW